MKTIYMLVKFFNSATHADDFVNGRVFVNRLSKFKGGEGDDESGRMDRHEGTVAWLQPGGSHVRVNGMDISEDLAGPLQVQKNWLNHLHVFCMHACHSGDLDLSKLSNENVEAEALRQQLTIDDRCLALGRYAVVVKDVAEFVNRMRSYASARNYPIACKLVEYYDPVSFSGHFRDIESVFWKQKRYSFQREFRFVINSGSPGELPLCMDIGDLRHITLQLESTDLNSQKFIGGQIEFGINPVDRPSRGA